jgi:hypothetical protein
MCDHSCLYGHSKHGANSHRIFLARSPLDTTTTLIVSYPATMAPTPNNDLLNQFLEAAKHREDSTNLFRQERTIHNLINARAKLEHDIKRLKKAYEEERAKRIPNLVVQNINAELCRALEQSRQTLKDLLEGNLLSPGALLKQKAELQNEKSGLLLQVAELQQLYNKSEKRRQGEEACATANLDDVYSDRARMQGELDQAKVVSADLRQEIRQLEEALGIS